MGTYKISEEEYKKYMKADDMRTIYREIIDEWVERRRRARFEARSNPKKMQTHTNIAKLSRYAK